MTKSDLNDIKKSQVFLAQNLMTWLILEKTYRAENDELRSKNAQWRDLVAVLDDMAISR